MQKAARRPQDRDANCTKAPAAPSPTSKTPLPTSPEGEETDSLDAPTFKENVGGLQIKQLTEVNKDILDQLAKPSVEQRWVKTTDGKEMLTWVILPPHFDASKKYPTLLFCEGGPQSAWHSLARRG